MTRPVHGGNLTWAAQLAGCSPGEILDFSASINPLGPPKSAIAAIYENLSFLSNYPDPNYSQLRSSLSQFHQISPEWILPGNGSAELLTWACWELSQQAVTYLITPAFSDYRRALTTFAAKVHQCPLNFWHEVRETSHQGGLIINNPHNPTGNLWRREEILSYLEEFNLVVVDEAFMDFLEPSAQQSLVSVVQEYPNLVILRSLTKFYSLPGLRLGYAIAHPERLKRWQNWRDPWPINVLAAAAGVAVLQDREFQQKTWKWLIEAKSELFQGIASIPGLKPIQGAANFLLAETEQPSTLLQKELLQKHRILIRDCLSFSELGDKYFRVAVKLKEDNQRLIEVLDCLLPISLAP